MAINIAEAILGETRGMIPVHSVQDYHTGLISLGAQASRSVRIFTQTFAHDLYDVKEWSQLLQKTITGRQKLQVRILVRDTSDLVQRGHHLVALMRRLPSFIAIHAFPEEAANERDEFVVVDDTGLLKRYPRNELAGYFEFRTADAAIKARYFDTFWERSAPCQELSSIAF